MNTIIKTNICLPMAATFLTLALAGPAAAAKYVPFKGSMQGNETGVLVGGPPPTTLLVDGSVTGVATHLGKFTLTYKFTVSLLPATWGQGIGSAQLVAANGDIIFTTSLGQGTPDEDTPDLQHIVEIHTITGGTGRFAGAQGSFTVVRLVAQPGGVTSGSFEGTITSPGAAH
jgi:hypothetical protein